MISDTELVLIVNICCLVVGSILLLIAYILKYNKYCQCEII